MKKNERMTDKYAVIGNPIAHSKSPQIHQAFAKQTNQDISYESVLAPLNGFETIVSELIKQGYKGANVTVPFKFEAFKCSHAHTQWSDAARAANTLSFTDEITGDNTDGIGLVNDIRRNIGLALQGRKVLLLGAGGAASGVVLSLLLERPSLLVIANRTLEKAETLQTHLGLFLQHEKVVPDWNSLQQVMLTTDFSSLKSQQFDIVINATSTGLSDTALPIPGSIFAKCCLAYEMMYGRETPFMTQARAAGAQVEDGLGMLVEQAAEAFYLWRHVRPQTAPVIAMLRNL